MMLANLNDQAKGYEEILSNCAFQFRGNPPLIFQSRRTGTKYETEKWPDANAAAPKTWSKGVPKDLDDLAFASVCEACGAGSNEEGLFRGSDGNVSDAV